MADTRSRPKAAPEPDGADEPHICTFGLCPICFAVSALQPLRPEVVEHLMSAGRELLLAVKTVLDQRADDTRDERTRLERIDIA